MNHSVTLSQTIQASPDAIFRAFTTPGGLLDWCANAVELDTAKGSYLFLWSEKGYQLTGSIGEMVENTQVNWHIHTPAPGQVSLQILPGEENGTQLSLSMSGEYRGDTHISFWNEALINLKAVLETGLDRRVYDRPMLGILIGGLLDEANQARYKSPVPFGIIISSTMPGLGAEEVGLAENDILFEMDGVEIRDYRDLRGVIAHYKAGETVRISWYRAGEEHSGELTFSGRPIPFIPASPAELADYVQSIYARSEAELAEIIEDATEAQAEYRPNEKEWNVKEILAHIILSERAIQFWVASTKEGDLIRSWNSNDFGLVESVVSTYPTLKELVAELQRTQQQTIALLRRLPPEIVDYKGTYTNIVTTLGEQGLPIHTRMHVESAHALLAEAQT